MDKTKLILICLCVSMLGLLFFQKKHNQSSRPEQNSIYNTDGVLKKDIEEISVKLDSANQKLDTLLEMHGNQMLDEK